MTNVIALSNDAQSSKERLKLFATAYADNGGDHIKAYITAGFNADSAGQNAKKYLDKHNDYVMAVVKKQMGQDASLMRRLLLTCAQDETIPWASRLKAIELTLKNSGINKDTLVIEDKKASDLTPEQRQREIDDLIVTLQKKNA